MIKRAICPHLISKVYNPLNKLVRRIMKMTAYIQALAMLLIPIGLGFLAYAANIVGQPGLWKESITYIVAGIIAISFGGIVLKKVLKRVQTEEDEKKDEREKREQDRRNVQALIGEAEAEKQEREQGRQNIRTLIDEVKGLRQDLRNRDKGNGGN